MQLSKLVTIGHFAICTFTFAKLPPELAYNFIYKHLLEGVMNKSGVCFLIPLTFAVVKLKTFNS